MIALASDHGGLDLKNAIVAFLREQQIECTDLGTDGTASVDYPDFAEKVAAAVVSGSARAGILVCGTGIGMSISANKIPGIRAALVHDEFTAQMAAEHNDANILVLGGRVLSVEQGVRLVNIWLTSRYEGGRHQRRLDKIAALE
ncbi:ribose 5-phosphate isomerase B [Pelovirga terrestris]|uniref:Ribose 5-phosphate isomerase B n=1 Tax=Pelovirga terrestris TaxID=2771352 RepID=A0A8J6UQT8_9BACT|nr:ribose 5-phosphate isomerase B [Pelovirga terrestris]MBD1399601.1 ribose 5-phosphate isomerase B [Pelovirga terrestris]